MKEFLYFAVGGVFASWAVGAFLIASGDLFYNSGCLECSGLFGSDCVIKDQSTQCSILGNLENLSRFTHFMQDSGIYGWILLMFALGKIGLLAGAVAWILKKMLLLFKNKIVRF